MSATRKPLVAGNWKMNNNHLEALALTQQLAFRLNDKDFAASGRMLEKLGCRYVLAGHSERRQYHHEDDALVNAKVQAILRHDMAPVLCLGEPLVVRQAGDHVQHCILQVDAGLAGLTGEQVAGMVIAYEPVWAIGTGQVATPEDAQEVCAAIRERVSACHGHDVAARVRILYGGSVNPDNMPAIMAQSDIDGALVGGASLDYEGYARKDDDSSGYRVFHRPDHHEHAHGAARAAAQG